MLPIILTSCQNDSPFEDIPCTESGSPDMVFKACRQYIFNAKFWDEDYNLISESKIWMMATGKPWDYDPDQQMELIIQYEYDNKLVEKIKSHSINPVVSDRNWNKQEVTGIIENVNGIWMHPFRANQYFFMEIAPFPEVRLPLEIGQSWDIRLNIHEGWGDWENSTLNNYYKVVGYETINLPLGQLDTWRINSFTEAPFGNSTHNFWFHPELGFVKMIIHNYAGQTLEIELIDVIED
jgi:hypothetical protein